MPFVQCYSVMTTTDVIAALMPNPITPNFGAYPTPTARTMPSTPYVAVNNGHVQRLAEAMQAPLRQAGFNPEQVALWRWGNGVPEGSDYLNPEAYGHAYEVVARFRLDSWRRKSFQQDNAPDMTEAAHKLVKDLIEGFKPSGDTPRQPPRFLPDQVNHRQPLVLWAALEDPSDKARHLRVNEPSFLVLDGPTDGYWHSLTHPDKTRKRPSDARRELGYS